MIRKILYIALSVVLLTGVGIYYYVFIYSAGPRSAAGEEGIAIQADSLAARFSSDETSANALYLRKVVEVTGTVIQVSVNQQGQQTLTLGNTESFSNVFVTMQRPVTIVAGQTITIKGFCDGFLSDVVITGGISSQKPR